MRMTGTDRGPWIQTFTGRAFHYADPQPEDVHVWDIAQSLSNQCRFGGHASRFYSVAEHSIHVSQRLTHPELRLIGLLHDATEAYMLDLPTPLKKMLPDYVRYENGLWGVIAARFHLPADIPAEVHEADRRMLITERAQLFGTMIPWPQYADVVPYDVRIQCLSPGEARVDFMNEFNAIMAVL